MYSTIIQSNCNTDEFVDFWASFYTYPSENLYLINILKPSYSLDDLKELFIWKNGMRLSTQKYSSFEKNILNKLELVNILKLNFSMDEFNISFSELSTIWKIFLLHCIKPHCFPIFDQHVFRAMMFIKNNTIMEVSKSDCKKLSQYNELYLPFFQSVVSQTGRDAIKIDHALWVFGKSLKMPLLSKVLNL